MLPDRIPLTNALLRPWSQGDRAPLLRHANNRKVWRNLRDRFPHPYGDSEADEWLAYAAGDPAPWGVYAVEVEGEAAGTIALLRRTGEERYSAEIGYWLGEQYWGRGIMTEAVQALTTLALAEPDLFRLFAPVFSWNEPSMRLLEKAGYRREGVLRRAAVKDGVVIDEVMHAITRDPGLPYSPAPALEAEPGVAPPG